MAGTVTLKVTRADNEIMAYLNGNMIYDKKTEGNPLLNDQIQISGLMQAGANELILVGVNWGGPATFEGSVDVPGMSMPFSYTAGSTPNGIVWNRTFNLTY